MIILWRFELATRLSKGEQGNRKRMAEVGCVYDVSPVPRTPAAVLVRGPKRVSKAAPKARNKWAVASVVEDASMVVGWVFDEAQRRDPQHRRQWIPLVDGNNHQIERIAAEARSRQVKVPIVVDFAWQALDEVATSRGSTRGAVALGHTEASTPQLMRAPSVDCLGEVAARLSATLLRWHGQHLGQEFDSGW